jgi:hypothetical protein
LETGVVDEALHVDGNAPSRVWTPERATLVARAVLPPDTVAPGPPSGAFSDPNNGRTPPYPGQVVLGISSMLRGDDGTFWAMPDNGFGSKDNSKDFLLRQYRFTPHVTLAIATVVDGPLDHDRCGIRLIVCQRATYCHRAQFYWTATKSFHDRNARRAYRGLVLVLRFGISNRVKKGPRDEMDHDVLCGRGLGAHGGNLDQRFGASVRTYRVQIVSSI